MRDERESSGILRRRNHDLARAEVRGRLASAVALPTVMARGTAIHCPRDHSQARRNARNAQLVAVLLHQNFIASWLGWRLKDAVRRARKILLRPEHPDVGFDFVVVRGKIVVSDGPIISQAVVRLSPEIDRSKAQRDSTPMVGASAHDARAIPAKGRAGRSGVGLAFDRPRSRRCDEFVFETVAQLQSMSADAAAAMRQFVRPHVLFEVFTRIESWARFQHYDAQAAFGKHLRRSPTGSS